MGTSVPPINKRSVNTQTLVKNGETVVLGGVFQQETSKTTQKVPVLGDLPYLGRIFREDAQKSANRELLIFVTPKIIKEGLKEYAARAPKGK
jgi:type IV pilus assembly protein PilQ